MNNEVKAGDIIFVRPNNLLFKIVRWRTKGRFGHIGLIAGYIRTHIVIAEADYGGMDLNDLVWRFVREENYSIYRINDITEAQREGLIKECMSYVGLPYDKKAWINFIIGRAWFGSDKEMYCSEAIYRALCKYGIVEDTYDPEKISPADIYRMLESRLTLIEEIEF